MLLEAAVGRVAGARAAALGALTMGATILGHVEYFDAPPLSGPDGLDVTLVLIWRAALAGQAAALWAKAGVPRGPGWAGVYPSIASFARARRGAPERDAVLLVARLADAAGRHPPPRAWPAIHRLVGAALRETDCVIGLESAGFAVVLPGTAAHAVPTIVARIESIVGGVGAPVRVRNVPLDGASVPEVLNRMRPATPRAAPHAADEDAARADGTVPAAL
jgi:hypothetical protein